MSHNINLYRPRPKSAADHFSRTGLALIVLCAIGAGVLLHRIETMRQEQTRVALARALADAERLQRQIGGLPGAGPDAALDARAAEVDALERSAAGLASGLLGRSDGFSAHLRALGRTTRDGVWLTAVRLDNAAGSLVLEGRALDAARVPAYIAGLRSDAVLAPTDFEALELNALAQSASAEGVALAPHTVEFRLQGTLRPARPAAPGVSSVAPMAAQATTP